MNQVPFVGKLGEHSLFTGDVAYQVAAAAQGWAAGACRVLALPEVSSLAEAVAIPADMQSASIEKRRISGRAIDNGSYIKDGWRKPLESTTTSVMLMAVIL